MKRWGWILLSVMTTAMCGCSTIEIDPGVRQALTTVRLNPVVEGEVKVSGSLPGPYDVGPSNGYYGSIYTAPIGLFHDLWHYGEHGIKKTNVFKRVLKDRDIDVVQTVQKSLESLLTLHATFGLQIVPPPEPEPEIDVESTTEASAALDRSKLNPVGFDLESSELLPSTLEPLELSGETLPNFPMLPVHPSEEAAAGKVVPRPFPPADAELTVTVHYGVDNVGAVDESWLPWVTVTGELTSADGTILWRKSEKVDTRTGDLSELPFPSPFGNRIYVKRNYDQGAKLGARRLIKHLLDR